MQETRNANSILVVNVEPLGSWGKSGSTILKCTVRKQGEISL
jgi:hypothetical protein